VTFTASAAGADAGDTCPGSSGRRAIVAVTNDASETKCPR
jgi:hypothetical protein